MPLKLQPRNIIPQRDITFTGKGIQPDIKLEYKYSGPEDESYDMKYDNQLQKAISVVKEKIN